MISLLFTFIGRVIGSVLGLVITYLFTNPLNSGIELLNGFVAWGARSRAILHDWSVYYRG